MKKISFVILFSVCSLFSFSQWAWQNPYPQGNPLFSLHFPDANTGYAVGDNSTVLKPWMLE
jgi:hypothetical protein